MAERGTKGILALQLATEAQGEGERFFPLNKMRGGERTAVLSNPGEIHGMAPAGSLKDWLQWDYL